MNLPTGPYAPKINPSRASDILERKVRQATRTFAVIILSYLAWKGVAGLLISAQSAKDVAAYAVIFGLLALYCLV